MPSLFGYILQYLSTARPISAFNWLICLWQNLHLWFMTSTHVPCIPPHAGSLGRGSFLFLLFITVSLTFIKVDLLPTNLLDGNFKLGRFPCHFYCPMCNSTINLLQFTVLLKYDSPKIPDPCGRATLLFSEVPNFISTATGHDWPFMVEEGWNGALSHCREPLTSHVIKV